MEVVQEEYYGVFGDGSVEGRSDLDERMVVGEVVGGTISADDGDEAFGGYVID